jgi:PBP1b-binding outer membrane lipoprotein LpoB
VAGIVQWAGPSRRRRWWPEAAAAGGCGHETKVTRVDTGVVTDLSGRWNDTDSQMVAEAMVQEALANPWLGNFTKGKNRQPVVIVGTVLNKSHEHINVQTFVNDLERELTNSQKVTFVAGKGEREEVREERREQAVHAREDTQKGPGKEIGADYMMRGSICDDSGRTGRSQSGVLPGRSGNGRFGKQCQVLVRTKENQESG